MTFGCLILNNITLKAVSVVNTLNKNPILVIIKSKLLVNKIKRAMVISTNSGLWRYVIGDTIRFSSTFPFRIRITGRIKNFINAFGEELIIENAENALEKTLKDHNSSIIDYTAAPLFWEVLDITNGKLNLRIFLKI